MAKKTKATGSAPRKPIISQEKSQAARAAGKSHPGAGTLYDYKNKQLTGLGLAVIILGAAGIGAVIWGASTNWKFIPGLELITPGTQPGQFSIGVWNGVTFEKLNNDDFDYELFGTNNTADGPFTSLETGTSLDDISNADLVKEYKYFIVVYSGMVEVDDPKNSDPDVTIIVPFYERQDQIFKNASNTLYSYEEPSTTTVLAWNSETFAKAYPFAVNDNITILVATNKTQTNAAWVKGWDYFADSEIAPMIVVTFAGAAPAKSDFNIAGTTKALYGAMGLSFSFDSISSTPQTLDGVWGQTITAGITGITSIALYYGPTLLATYT